MPGTSTLADKREATKKRQVKCPKCGNNFPARKIKKHQARCNAGRDRKPEHRPS